MKERKYLAFKDDGHDYGEFEFYSVHRAGSKANIEDARREAVRKYGVTRAKQLKFRQIQLVCE